MSDAAVAERYARAIFELATETGQLEPLSKQFATVAEVYAASPALRAVLDNPLVEDEKRESVLADLAKRLGLVELSTNALRLLARRRRLSALPDIAKRLSTLADEKAGIVRAEVITATALPESIFIQLKEKLEKATKKKVVLERKQDPSLIAGMITRIGDNTIDGSVAGRLHELERQLLS